MNKYRIMHNGYKFIIQKRDYFLFKKWEYWEDAEVENFYRNGCVTSYTIKYNTLEEALRALQKLESHDRELSSKWEVVNIPHYA